MRWRNDTHFVEALYVVFLAFCCALLASCAHDPALQKKIESKSVQLPALAPQARADAAEKTIEAAPLSEEQKSKLEALTLSTTTELQSLREENARLRLLLVRELVNPQSSDREIDAIKTRILETEKESNKRWISAIDDARQILGRRVPEDRRFYRAFTEQTETPVKGEGSHATP
jgi:hypothetical protein